MDTFKNIVNTLLLKTTVKTATVEVTVNRNEFINQLKEWTATYEIQEKFCNANDWELTFHYRGLDCNVAVHSYMMFGDQIKVLVLAGDDAQRYYRKPTRDILENTSMYQFHLDEMSKV